MNFEWTTIADKGNYDEGFVEVYAKNKSNRAIVIMSFLAQHADPTPRILLTILLEGKIDDWTKGTIGSIFHDAEDYIKNVMATKFRYIDSIDHVQRQMFTLKNIDEFDYVSHGDYTFID
ncbi:MAG TPA: hypothetical protein VGN20_20335 [Mucilaginibacter sp.]|jgi:hypothetical protein